MLLTDCRAIMASDFSKGVPIKSEDHNDELIVNRCNIKQERNKSEYVNNRNYSRIQIKEELTDEESHYSDIDHCVDSNTYLKKELNTKVDIDDIKCEKNEFDGLPNEDEHENNFGEFEKATIPPVQQSGLPTREEDINKIIEYLDSKKKNQQDGIDFLFLSYAETFKKLSPRSQIHLKLKLAKLFANAELQLLEQTGSS
ncbi:uncharacterized protein LOC114328031 [Diabrotica virgifera virgifera]|uniref:BESS domain-containing protein n=1 Tax=Diabrotica virgifera virgifera TaxID=50390 RepID=A0ABM5KHY9_DIAVI|nr:uncharacterized protein LOC114328031 [Diabrotica virgifera virgifera]